jgi:hypothetical protein
METHSSESSDKEISWIIVRDKNSFLNYFDKWKHGWETAFRRKLSDSVLNRYFLDTPLGSPIVIIGFYKGLAIASSTLVPLSLKYSNSSEVLNYLQYIAAYILPNHTVGFDTYKKMLTLVKSEIINTQYEFILSFPNENAKSLMIRIGEFKLLDVGFFIRGKMEYSIINRLNNELPRPFFDENLLQWRIHNGIFRDTGIIFKVFQHEKNLLDVTSESYRKYFSGLMPWWTSWGEAPYSPSDNYRLNMCVYSHKKTPLIKRSFLLSDVF